MRHPLALSLTLLAGSTFALAQPPAANPNLAATVNGEQITLAEVDALLKTTLPLTPLTAAQKRQMRVEVLADMVDDVLLRQFLRKNGPKVDPAEIDAQLKAFGEKLKAEGKTLADFYKETGQTEAQVKEAWTTAMQLTGYVKSNATEEQLKAYFAANKDHFDRAEVKVRHVVLRAGKSASPAERAAAKEKLEAIRADIAGGKLDFADAAKKHSHCPSGPTGGDIGVIYRKGGIVDEAFAKAAFALKPGELSGVVETDFGYHLIQVTERKPGTPTTYDKSATDVLDTYSDEFRADLIAKLRKQGQIQITVP
ncbi:peptidylprolyl isomerase [Gemmata sp. JC673]|uniref:peptidylprolyl isomerase n=1 Tax=Gemmata algarum TaxID=2975278 RepID=A0ABU5FBN2_9BACT|nr:peptidyl-prolyl cis-trans isomerase [Gemmata algarum]MDY3563231.1 peptidylprolyl isomerase [Gemmata algarum]